MRRALSRGLSMTATTAALVGALGAVVAAASLVGCIAVYARGVEALYDASDAVAP